MEGTDFIVLAVVGAVTFFAGFQTGRLSASKGSSARGDGPTPISFPELPETGPGASASQGAQPRPRSSAPPPASAGGEPSPSASAPQPSRTAPPRRSSAPPPASAGLLDKGQGGKDRGS